MRRNLLILGLIGLAACGGGAGDAIVIPTTVEVTVSVPVVTAASSTTSTLPPTTIPATTVPVSTTAPVETTTTLSPEADVAAGWAEIAANLETCSRMGPDCDPLTVAALGSPYWGFLVRDNETRRADGLRYVVQPETHRTWQSVTMLGPDLATILICEFDANWIVDPQDPANPDDDIIVNDAKVNQHLNIDLVRVDGHWRESDVHGIDRKTVEVDECDD